MFESPLKHISETVERLKKKLAPRIGAGAVGGAAAEQPPKVQEVREAIAESTEVKRLVMEDGRSVLQQPPDRAITDTGDDRVRRAPIVVPRNNYATAGSGDSAVLRPGPALVYEYSNSFGVGGNAFVECVEPMVEENLKRLLDERGQDKVLVRGIACTVDGEGPLLPRSGNRLSTLNDILMNGQESVQEETLVTGFGQDSEELHHRTVQWLVEHPQNLRSDLGDAAAAESVFPALLVYDIDKLEPGHGIYGAKLKADTPSWSDALIQVYVLPYASR